ncbi:MAG: c-type cytochrome [Acidimicrobiia bacterium]|nr:c-type cytochrome [Acidimicrobiia bacterium]
MSSSVVLILAVVAGVVWLAFLGVAAIRRRGPEEVASNLSPGGTDELLETRRLEGWQKAAALMSAVLAIGIPLYFLGEGARQEGFAQEFNEQALTRGEEHWVELDCASCHGPGGSGGEASFVDPRSNVTVNWAAPSIDDVFLRYDLDEIRYWVTYGRVNTPMPPWGLDGGGPLTEDGVADLLLYLRSIQIDQPTVLGEIEPTINQANQALAGAEQQAETALVEQRQVVDEINQAGDLAPKVAELGERGREILDESANQIDTDGDGVSDSAEAALTELSQEAINVFRVVQPVEFDPEAAQSVEGTDDMTTAQQALEQLETGAESNAILGPAGDSFAAALDNAAMEGGISVGAIAELNELAARAEEQGIDVPGEITDLESAQAYVEALPAPEGGEDEGATSTTTPADGGTETTVTESATETTAAEGATETTVAGGGEGGGDDLATQAQTVLDGGADNDGDGLSNAGEQQLTQILTDADSSIVPSEIPAMTLDPTGSESSGQPDLEAAETFVSALESEATNLSVTSENIERVLPPAEGGVAFLENQIENTPWAVDYQGVADAAFDGNVADAKRAVGLFNGYCSRCHTAGWSAGVPFSKETGSGALGPSLEDGRPVTQFGPAPASEEEVDLLTDFLISGSVADEPYGLNGMGTGRMPAFGGILSGADIEMLAQFLRGGNLNGMGGGH